MMDNLHVVRYHQSWTENIFDMSEFTVFELDNELTHTLYVQMELCDEYLEDLMDKLGKSKSTIYKYMIQIYQGVKHIHSKGVIHADISRSNIFSRSGVLKIADFGKGAPLLVSEEDLGFYLYRAPETFKEQIWIDPKIDIYSAGLIFYELLYLKITFIRERIAAFKDIQSGNLHFEDEVSKLLLSVNPEHRPTASVVILIFENADLLADEIAEQNDGEEPNTS